jgi:hypothetical protein
MLLSFTHFFNPPLPNLLTLEPFAEGDLNSPEVGNAPDLSYRTGPAAQAATANRCQVLYSCASGGGGGGGGELYFEKKGFWTSKNFSYTVNHRTMLHKGISHWHHFPTSYFLLPAANQNTHPGFTGMSPFFFPFFSFFFFLFVGVIERKSVA